MSFNSSQAETASTTTTTTTTTSKGDKLLDLLEQIKPGQDKKPASVLEEILKACRRGQDVWEFLLISVPQKVMFDFLRETNQHYAEYGQAYLNLLQKSVEGRFDKDAKKQWLDLLRKSNDIGLRLVRGVAGEFVAAAAVRQATEEVQQAILHQEDLLVKVLPKNTNELFECLGIMTEYKKFFFYIQCFIEARKSGIGYYPALECLTEAFASLVEQMFHYKNGLLLKLIEEQKKSA